MLKKLKKGLKKAAKAAIPVGAAILAAKAMKKDKGALTSDMPRSMVPMSKRMVQGLNVKPSDNVTAGINKMAKMNQFGRSGTQGGDENMDYLYRANGGRAGYKKGGKVKGCGVAKRGFGRAMKRGK
mgnify:CR=1 FL=1